MLLHHDPKGNVGSFRNDNAARANGDWLCFLDADDELAPNYVRGMAWALKRALRGPKKPDLNRPLLLTPLVSKVIKGKRRTPMFYPPVNLLLGNYLVIGTMIEKRWFDQVGGFENFPHGFEDWSLWYKCARLGAQVIQVRHSVYYEHVNPDSLHRAGWRDHRNQIKIHLRVQKELEAWTP